MTSLSVGDFSDLLDRLGPTLSHWPAGQRQAAETLLRQSDEAAARLAEALALADAVRSAQPVAPAGLTERILAAALKPKA